MVAQAWEKLGIDRKLDSFRKLFPDAHILWIDVVGCGDSTRQFHIQGREKPVPLFGEYYLNSLSETEFYDHISQIVGYNTPTVTRGSNMAYQETSDRVERKAKEDGEALGLFFVSISSKNIPLRILWDVAGRMGRMMGYGDIDTNDVFKQAFIERFVSYGEANASVLSLKQPEGE